MNVLKRCCFRSLQENKKRTIVTVIGVILATALITGVACLAVSVRVSLIEYEKTHNGDYHYWFSGVKDEDLKYYLNNSNIERVGITKEIGYAVLQGSQNPEKPYLYLRAINEEGIRAISLQLTEGRMPENDSEIVIARHIRYNGMVNLNVGDVLSLEICRRMSDGNPLGRKTAYTYEAESLVPIYRKNYTIVGVVERPNYDVEDRMAPGYSVFTCLDAASGKETLRSDVQDPDRQAAGVPKAGNAAADTLELYVSFNEKGLKQAQKVIANILGVPQEVCGRYFAGQADDEDQIQIQEHVREMAENYWLLKWIRFTLSEGSMRWIYSMAALAVAVVIVTSVFCIRNSFMISLTEKMKLYGRLASVGTTSKQQRRIVYYEAGVLGSVGVPLGIVSGILATFVLVRLVSGLMDEAMGIPLVFGVSWLAVAAAAVLSAVTILLSASKAARLAAKISPINAIRGNDMIKTGRRGLRCPWPISRIFGIGGRIAYKNLKRARVKYRTTVISIVVSVAVFIGLSTFLQLMGIATGAYYDNIKYQIDVTLTRDGAYEGGLRIASLDGIEAVEIQRFDTVCTDGAVVPYTEEYRQYNNDPAADEEYVILMTLGESGYTAFCKEIGVSVEQAQDKAILYAHFEKNYYDATLEKLVVQEGDIARYRPGDIIKITPKKADPQESGVENGTEQTDPAAQKGGSEETIGLEILTQTDIKPMSMSNTSYSSMVLIVSDRWFEEHGFAEESNGYVSAAVRCKDAGAMEEAIRGMMQAGGYHYTLRNYDSIYKSERATITMISIFLYGFITVMSLIGITNIFNTITTNMELRAPEFAMLRSVGMTGKEFKRMIWLEGFFYVGKALAIGIPLGILLSWGFWQAMRTGIIASKYVVPWGGIAAASAAAAVLMWIILHFSMSRIKRRNIIETIQNENI